MYNTMAKNKALSTKQMKFSRPAGRVKLASTQKERKSRANNLLIRIKTMRDKR